MVANLVDILDPGLVIVGGGFVNVPGLLDRSRRGRSPLGLVRPGEGDPDTGSRTCGPLAGVIGAGLTLLERVS